ncbi:helix-turn-helix transcriptional regulator [Paenibacillus albicereus]|uniref:Helix-turn-helix transcriptional regulator n=1 Tax=Paenibacillus albicereus TaxID=2726185 RepID=A0A6H2GVQ5_9BACL|nr:helix-turn-helix domain-containing protein [Paenibacillus albicereus]QJC51487.1 helix-turn-helix transcriptional regulator [Paenibacillus albicereus]
MVKRHAEEEQEIEEWSREGSDHPHICSVLEILGAKWSILVIAELYKGPRRFQQLQRDVAVVRTQSLTNVLRHLESTGIVRREVYPSVPVMVEYSLTDKGRDFQAALKEMENWAIRWGSGEQGK